MKTIVVFRFWKGEVIALFPEDIADQEGNCSSFMHVGQHGAADYEGIVARSRPATPAEYENLAKELSSSPYHYDLDIRQRASRGMREKRLANWRQATYQGVRKDARR